MQRSKVYTVVAICCLFAFAMASAGCNPDATGPMPDASVDAGDVSADTHEGPLSEAALLGHPGKNYLYDIVRSGPREFYVVGETDGPLLNGLETNGGWDGYVAKLSRQSSGSVWLKSVGGSGDERLTSAALATDGVWVGGTEYQSSGLPDGFVAKYSSDGQQQMRIDLGSEGFGEVNGLAQGPDGSVAVAGTSGFGESLKNTARVGLIDADGNLQWQTTVTGDAQYLGFDVAVSDSRIYLAGDRLTSDSRRGFVRAWSLDGTNQLDVDIDSSGYTAVRGVAVEGDRFFVAGETTGTIDGVAPRGDSAGFVLAYSETGNLAWKEMVHSDRRVRFSDISIDHERITVAGWATAQVAGSGGYYGSTDALAMQIDLNGDRLGVWQRGGVRDDWAAAAVSFKPWENAVEGRHAKVVANSDGWMLGRNSTDPNGYVYDEGPSRSGSDHLFVNEGEETFTSMSFGPQGRLYGFGWASGDFGGGDPHAGAFSGLVAEFDGGLSPTDKMAVDGENVSFEAGAVTEDAIYVGGMAYAGIEDNENDMEWMHPIIVCLSKSGEVRWVQDFSDGDAPFRQITGLDVTPSGSIAFIGNTHTVDSHRDVSGPRDGFMGMLFPGAGSVDWIQAAAGPGDDNLTDLEVDADGNLLVSGYFTNSFGPLEVDGDLYSGYVAKYDSTGSRQWVRQVEEPGWYTSALSLVTGPDGGIYVGGLTTKRAEGWDSILGDSDGYIARFDEAGRRTDIWQIRGTADEYPENLSVNSNRDLAVVGSTFGSVAGVSNAGGRDGFVGFKGRDDSTFSLYRVGSPGADFVDDVAFDSEGWLHIVGSVSGSVWGLPYNGGDTDALYARVWADRAVEGLNELTEQ